MKREEVKDLLPIIQAYAEGKAIEYSNDGEEWFETATPTWNSGFVYRIKSESKYRPFKTVKECYDEMLRHKPFGWMRNVKTENMAVIGGINNMRGRLVINWATNESVYVSAEDVSSNYVFADGATFGIKEE